MANKYFKFVENYVGFFYGIVIGTIGVSLFHKPALFTSIIGLISAIILISLEFARNSQSNSN